jgi:amidohydrolase family protein
MEARDAFADRVQVELVAFPQSGLLVRPGTTELLEAAVRAGADLVGGLDPAGFDRRPVEHLDAVFAIAGRHGCGLDIHLHEGGELGAFTIDLIIERTRALGLAGRVTISHAFALAEVPGPRLAGLVEGLAAQRVSLTTVAPATGRRSPSPRCVRQGWPSASAATASATCGRPGATATCWGGPPCSPGGPGPVATRSWPPPSSWPPPAGRPSSGSTATALTLAAGPTSPWSRPRPSQRRWSPTRPAPWCSGAAGWSPAPDPAVPAGTAPAASPRWSSWPGRRRRCWV